MIQLDLDNEERQILTEALEGTLGELGMEIASTDRKEFRDILKKRQAVLRKALQAVGQMADI